MRDLLRGHIAKEQAQLGDRIGVIERDIGLIDQRVARLTDLLIDLSIDKATYNERKAELLGRKRTLQDRLENDQDSTFWQIVAERFELGLDAYTGYLTGIEAEKRESVQIVSSNLLACGKELIFPMVFPFDEIRKWSKSTNGAPYRGAVRTLRANKSAKWKTSQTLIKEIERHRSHKHFHDGEVCFERSPSHP